MHAWIDRIIEIICKICKIACDNLTRITSDYIKHQHTTAEATSVLWVNASCFCFYFFWCVFLFILWPLLFIRQTYLTWLACWEIMLWVNMWQENTETAKSPEILALMRILPVSALYCFCLLCPGGGWGVQVFCVGSALQQLWDNDLKLHKECRKQHIACRLHLFQVNPHTLFMMSSYATSSPQTTQPGLPAFALA